MHIHSVLRNFEKVVTSAILYHQKQEDYSAQFELLMKAIQEECKTTESLTIWLAEL